MAEKQANPPRQADALAPRAPVEASTPAEVRRDPPPALAPHRAEIDHERLAVFDVERGSAWRRLLQEMGLGGIPIEDPALPQALRDLFRVTAPDPWRALSKVGAVVAAVAWIGLAARSLPDVRLIAFMAILGPAVAALGAFAGFLLDVTLRGAGIVPPVETRAVRRDAALAKLRAEPFVRWIGGRLVENVPAMGWLEAQRRELEQAEARCLERIAHIDRLVERIADLATRLGREVPDPHREGLAALKADEAVLLERTRALIAEVDARQAELGLSLERVRVAAEMTVLRQRSDELLGGDFTDEVDRIGADLELEFAELQVHVDSLREALLDEEARWKAVGEVEGAR